MILANLPAFQVVIPLLAAPACVLLQRPALAWGLSQTVSGIALGIAILLLNQVLASGPISYALGNWAAPWGIEYRVDLVNAFVLLIVAGTAAIVLAFAKTSVEREIPRHQIPLFYCSFLLCVTGLLGIAITGDLFNLFVFLEISSLSSYTLISLGKDRRALTAAFQYLIMGTIGATFIVIGVGLLYMMTGTLNMADLAVRVPPIAGTRTILAAFAFLTVGAGLKLALFPLHLWLPNAYTYAPSAVTAFLAGTATKVAVYVLLRFFFTIFGADFTLETMSMDALLLPLALTAVLVASGVAIFQQDAKRMLAYSSVAQVGYMALGIGFFSVTGLTAGIVHLFNHAIIKTALFMALGCIVLRTGSCHIPSLVGIGRRMPWTMAAFVFGAMSLVGVPLTAGFISKYYLAVGALEKGWWWLVFLLVASSLIAVVYIGRVVEIGGSTAASGDPRPARCSARRLARRLLPGPAAPGAGFLRERPLPAEAGSVPGPASGRPAPLVAFPVACPVACP